jgi:hypothetical protein
VSGAAEAGWQPGRLLPAVLCTTERLDNGARGRAAHPGTPGGAPPFPTPEELNRHRFIQPLRGRFVLPARSLPGVGCATPGSVIQPLRGKKGGRPGLPELATHRQTYPRVSAGGTCCGSGSGTAILAVGGPTGPPREETGLVAHKLKALAGLAGSPGCMVSHGRKAGEQQATGGAPRVEPGGVRAAGLAKFADVLPGVAVSGVERGPSCRHQDVIDGGDGPSPPNPW